MLDFDDLLLRCANELEKDPDFAASARWRFRHVFVDEYQDVNPAQVGSSKPGSAGTTIFASSAIPTRRSMPGTGVTRGRCVDFPERHPGCRVVIRLAMNYRSSDAVLAVASSVLRGRAASISRSREHRRRRGPTFAAPVSRSATLGRDARQSVVGYETDGDEARGVVAALRRARSAGRVRGRASLSSPAPTPSWSCSSESSSRRHPISQRRRSRPSSPGPRSRPLSSG